MSAYDAIVEALNYAKPDNEDDAREVAETALYEYIDNQLIYTNQVLELWDGSTHEEVDLTSHETIMDAIIASTYYQLREEWQEHLESAVEEYVEGLEDDA